MDENIDYCCKIVLFLAMTLVIVAKSVHPCTSMFTIVTKACYNHFYVL